MVHGTCGIQEVPVRNQGDRDQESSLGQPGSDSEQPAGTTGRTGNSGTENWQQGNTDTNRRPNRHDDDDDEDSGLGIRTGLR
jgi:hypothetical protein